MNLENNIFPNLVGYVTVRKFAGYALPVPVQNKLLRTYCSDNNYNYVLPLCELILPKNYMGLYGTIERCSYEGHIGMCSIYMFPKTTKKFNHINKLINKNKINFHFIFKDKKIDYFDLEEYYFLSRMRYYIKSNKSDLIENIK